MKNCLLVGALVLLRTTLIRGLTCADGFELDSSFVLEQNWTTKKCSSDQVCERTEVELMGQYNLMFNAIRGGCVDASHCNDPCERFLESLMGTDDNQTVIASLRHFSVRDCRKTCCSSNNCNAKRQMSDETPSSTQTVQPTASPTSGETSFSLKFTTSSNSTLSPSAPSATSNQDQTTPKSTSAILTSTSPDPPLSSLSCSFGYQSADVDLSEWRTERCPFEEGNEFVCIRQAVALDVVNGRSEVSIELGGCIPRSSCSVSCTILAEQLFEDGIPIGNSTITVEELIIKSCDQVCCGYNGCNERSILEMQNEGGGVGCTLRVNNVIFSILSFICILYIFVL